MARGPVMYVRFRGYDWPLYGGYIARDRRREKTAKSLQPAGTEPSSRVRLSDRRQAGALFVNPGARRIDGGQVAGTGKFVQLLAAPVARANLRANVQRQLKPVRLAAP